MAIRSKDPKKFSNKYKLKELLGTGAFGIVKKCEEKATGLEFAVKIFNTKEMSQEELDDLAVEARIGRNLNHPNIVQLHESIKEENTHYLVLELITGGELLRDIAKRRFYNEAMASHYMQQILQGVQYCHRKGILHRDLKPDNILLANQTEGAAVKLADFGLSIQIHDRQKGLFGFAGTPDYMAPEVIKMTMYGRPVDVWSCGVILYLMLFGYHPFRANDEDKLFELIEKGDFAYPPSEKDTTTPEARNLIDSMLKVNQNKRITAANALRHPWILKREQVASVLHRQNTVIRLKKFNARRKFKAAILVTLVAVRRFPHRSALVKMDAIPQQDQISKRKQEIVTVTRNLLDSITLGNFQNYSKMCDPLMTAFEPDAIGNLAHGINQQKFQSAIFSMKDFEIIYATILNHHVHLLGDNVACIAYVRLVQFKDNSGKVYTQQSDETRVWHLHAGKWCTVHFHCSASTPSTKAPSFIK